MLPELDFLEESLTVLTQFCPSKYAVTRHREAGFCVRGLASTGGHSVVLWTLTVVVLLEKILPPHFLIHGQAISHLCCSGRPHRIVRAVSMPGATVLLCFIFGIWLGFKTWNFNGPSILFSPSGVETVHNVSDVLCPKKIVLCLHYAWNLWYSTVESINQVIYPLWMPLLLANERSFLSPRITCP